ncbi:MAG: hypothetical protein EBY17_31270 [Acidobacteriia bacterium]|nr:hypothetical protein [Terriglobia bacterium]
MLRAVLSFGFVRALWLGAIRGARVSPAKLAQAGWSVAKTVFLTLISRDKQADQQTVSRRINRCLICPVFCRELNTCGDARLPEAEDPMGCFCYIPVKARIRDAVCWLQEPEQLGPECDAGWPKGVSA